MKEIDVDGVGRTISAFCYLVRGKQVGSAIQLNAEQTKALRVSYLFLDHL